MDFLLNLIELLKNNFVLLFALFGLVTTILMLSVKKRTALIASACILLVLVIGTTFALDQIRYTTFQEVYSKQLNNDTDVREITISIYGSSNGYPEREKSARIKDEKMLEAIINDLNDLELRKDTGSSRLDWDYTLVVTTNNQIGEKHSVTNRLYLNVNNNYINAYKVVDDTNHLKTVNALVESDEIDWVLER